MTDLYYLKHSLANLGYVCYQNDEQTLSRQPINHVATSIKHLSQTEKNANRNTMYISVLTEKNKLIVKGMHDLLYEDKTRLSLRLHINKKLHWKQGTMLEWPHDLINQFYPQRTNNLQDATKKLMKLTIAILVLFECIFVYFFHINKFLTHKL